MKTSSSSILFAFLIVLAGVLPSRDSLGQESPVATPPPPWPREFASGDTTVSVYQPQLDKWQDNQLTAYSAVEVKTGAAKTAS